LGRKVKRALILDRDGVINEDGDYLYRCEDFRFIPGIFPLCRLAQEKGYMLIAVTNQSGIARGYYSEADFDAVNRWMCSAFEAQGVHLDKVYYCPYHPKGKIREYRADSFDRKPNPGMFLRASEELGLDMKACITIGDRDSDMAAGRAAGVGKLLLLPGIYPYTSAADVKILSELLEAEAFL